MSTPQIVTFTASGEHPRPWALVPGGPYRFVRRRARHDLVEPVVARRRRRSHAVGHLAVSTAEWRSCDIETLSDVARELDITVLGTEVAPLIDRYLGYGLHLVGQVPHWRLDYVPAHGRTSTFLARIIGPAITLDDYADRLADWETLRDRSRAEQAIRAAAANRAELLRTRLERVAGAGNGWQSAVNGHAQVRISAEGLDRLLSMAGADPLPEAAADDGAYAL